jgi:hypothetical protein
MAFQPPGAEFLKRRLARATAVPPAERTANVAAFVESMQLMLDDPELLPLNSEGTAALPDTADRRSKVGWPAGCLYRLHVPPAACRRLPAWCEQLADENSCDLPHPLRRCWRRSWPHAPATAAQVWCPPDQRLPPTSEHTFIVTPRMSWQK